MGRRRAPLKPIKTKINGKQTSWLVRVPPELWKQEDTRDGRKYFPKEALALGYCNRLASDLRNYSDKARGLTDAQKIEAQSCFERLATVPGASMTVAVDEHLMRLAQSARSVTVEEAGQAFLDTKLKLTGRGSRKRTVQETRVRWNFFASAFPGRLMNTITPEEIHDWLLGLVNRLTGEPLALQTRRNIRRVVHAVFAFSKQRVRGWVAENPVSDVVLPAGEPHQVELMPVPEVRKIFEVCHEKLVPYMALCAFAGLRPDHAKRMTWEQIHFDRGKHGEIVIPQGTDKTNPARLIPMQPNLRAWLLRTPETRRQGKVFYTRERFRDLRKAMGYEKWPQDALRHDFATYRLKIPGTSFNDVAQEMGNSETVIRARYLGSVSSADSDLFWNIAPAKLSGPLQPPLG